MAYYLGIDTSAYTTSAAVCRDGEIVANVKRLLDVPSGERGLRQSDALFAHINSLPEVTESVGPYEYKAIGVSAFPRDEKGSYMPVFKAGEAVARSMGNLLGIPVHRFSHQKGHVMAALYSAGKTDLINGRFNAFHVSGGTTEILLCDNMNVSLIGGTNDLNAGQAIDRVGVRLGLPFPSGRYLEELAVNGKSHARPKISVSGIRCNLSGLENLAYKLLSDGFPKEDVAAFTLDFIASTLEKLTENLRKEYGLPIIYAGGVMSDEIIKDRLSRFDDTYFASPAFSSDNACGAALLTYYAEEGYIAG